MTVELNGTITTVFPIEQRKDFKFQRVQMQIDQNSEYPQTVEFQATEKTFGIVDQFAAGDVVKATCNLRWNLWQDKCFLSLSLWKLEREGSQSEPTSNGNPPKGYVQTNAPATDYGINTVDDLPF